MSLLCFYASKCVVLKKLMILQGFTVLNYLLVEQRFERTMIGQVFSV